MKIYCYIWLVFINNDDDDSDAGGEGYDVVIGSTRLDWNVDNQVVR